MCERFINLVLGCRHQKYTFPRTNPRTGCTHVTCIDCGREFEYDFERMKLLGPVHPAQVGGQK